MSPSSPPAGIQQSPPENDIFDIVVLAPKDSLSPFLFLGIGLLLVLIIAGLFLWWFLKKKSANSTMTPRSKVMEKLRALEIREHSMDPNRFAQDLSDALKDYLTERYRDPVRYETAQEFLRRSSEPGRSILPEAAAEELRQFLHLSEEVKFGNSSGAASLTAMLLQRAKTAVELCDVISEEREAPAHATS